MTKITAGPSHPSRYTAVDIPQDDAELRPVAQYAVKEWDDLDPTNKPDLAVLPDGRLLVSDPAHGRVMLVGTDGRVADTLDAVGGEALAVPRGIAFDASGEFVFASESTAGRVRRFPLSDFARR